MINIFYSCRVFYKHGLQLQRVQQWIRRVWCVWKCKEILLAELTKNHEIKLVKIDITCKNVPVVSMMDHTKKFKWETSFIIIIISQFISNQGSSYYSDTFEANELICVSNSKISFHILFFFFWFSRCIDSLAY